MCCRSILVLTIAFACCCAESMTAQEKKKKGGGIGAAATPFGTSRVVDATAAAPAPAFLVTLEERTKPRKVFLPRREMVGGAPGAGGPPGAGGFPGAGVAPVEPYVVTVYAIRRIQGDEPAKGYLHLGMRPGFGEYPEEDVRKIIQFKKDFAKKVAPIPEHVESADLTLTSHGLSLYFNLKTGECQWGSCRVPDGFFDALGDALADLEKLKAAKPAFQVK